MLTDSDTSMTERCGFDSGADAYVSKSADTEILLSRANALLCNASAWLLTECAGQMLVDLLADQPGVTKTIDRTQPTRFVPHFPRSRTADAGYGNS